MDYKKGFYVFVYVAWTLSWHLCWGSTSLSQPGQTSTHSNTNHDPVTNSTMATNSPVVQAGTPNVTKLNVSDMERAGIYEGDHLKSPEEFSNWLNQIHPKNDTNADLLKALEALNAKSDAQTTRALPDYIKALEALRSKSDAQTTHAQPAASVSSVDATSGGPPTSTTLAGTVSTDSTDTSSSISDRTKSSVINPFDLGTTAVTNKTQQGSMTNTVDKGSALTNTIQQGSTVTEGIIQGSTVTNAAIQGSSVESAVDEGSTVTNAAIQGSSVESAVDQGSTVTNAAIQGSSVETAVDQGSTVTNAAIQGSSVETAIDQGSTVTNAAIQGSSVETAVDQGSTAKRTINQGSTATNKIDVKPSRPTTLSSVDDNSTMREKNVLLTTTTEHISKATQRSVTDVTVSITHSRPKSTSTTHTQTITTEENAKTNNHAVVSDNETSTLDVNDTARSDKNLTHSTDEWLEMFKSAKEHSGKNNVGHPGVVDPAFVSPTAFQAWLNSIHSKNDSKKPSTVPREQYISTEKFIIVVCIVGGAMFVFIVGISITMICRRRNKPKDVDVEEVKDNVTPRKSEVYALNSNGFSDTTFMGIPPNHDIWKEIDSLPESAPSVLPETTQM